MGFGIHGASYKQSLLILRKRVFLDLYFIPPAAEVPKGALFPSIASAVPCQSLSRVRLCDAMDSACQAPLSVEFPRQEYWSWVALSSSRGSSRPRE